MIDRTPRVHFPDTSFPDPYSIRISVPSISENQGRVPLLLVSLYSLCAVVKVRSAIPENDIVKNKSVSVQMITHLFPHLSVSSFCRLLPGSRLFAASFRLLRFRSSSDSLPLPQFDLGLRLAISRFASLPRKEVIQPHLPIRLPCYDFTPVISLTFGSWPLSVTTLTSGAPNSHGVTGGVYKARERIHRGILIRDY